jgi:hypothetical protein
MTGRQTGRKPAESTAYLQFLGRTLDPIHTGVAVLDDKARIVHVSDAARHLLPVAVDPAKDYFTQMAAVEVRNRQGKRVSRETSAVTRALAGEAVDDYLVTITPPSGSPAILNAGTSAGTTMLTVSAPLMAMARPGSSNRMLFAAILPGAFGLVVLPAVSRKRRALALLFVVLSLMLMTACGGSIAANGLRSSSSAVKAGTYTFTITATSGNVSRSTTAKLVIK